tara:strand:- start:260 stop:1162 length:903 start_codon:yes stop_codon:yes gene_type:complete
MNQSKQKLMQSNVTIVGLGLMGGSLALALRNKCASITAIETNKKTCRIALENNIVDHITDNLIGEIQSTNILILATPVRTIINTLVNLTETNINNITDKILVLDIGSTKTQIVSQMQLLPHPFIGIGGHPMCGKESAGINNAEASLFQKAVFALTPTSNTNKEMIILAKEIVESIGSIPIELDAKQHDCITAFTSHLPYILSCSLVSTISNYSKSDPTIWKMVSSGFKDTTRLASSDIKMIVDILLTNKNAIKHALTQCRNELDEIEILLDKDSESLTTTLNNIRKTRNTYINTITNNSL